MEKIIIDLCGDPCCSDSPCLRTGYGYMAYSNSNRPFFNNLMRELSIWSGHTDSFDTRDGDYYRMYELDCRDKQFFKSSTFRKICQRSNVELIICEDDMKPLQELFYSIERR